MRKSAILATVALLALAACGKKQAEAPQSADNGSSEVANAETAKAKFVPGTYTFEPNKRGADQDPSVTYLSLDQYKDICSQVKSITNSLGNSWGIAAMGSGSTAFSVLLSKNNITGVSSNWLDESQFTKESSIRGACAVTVSVSGIHNGTSTNEDGVTYAQEFIVIEDGEVIVSSGNISAIFASLIADTVAPAPVLPTDSAPAPPPPTAAEISRPLQTEF